MGKVIIYTSNTGFTKEYAEILQQETGINAYGFKEAKHIIKKDDEVIYMGWIMAGKIKNYKKAKDLYNIIATCAVGMSVPDDKQYNELVKNNNITEKFFYLQGGFDKKRLRGIYKFMMNSLEKIIKPKLEAKENKTKEELEMLEMMNNGKDCVRKENLNDLIEYIKNN